MYQVILRARICGYSNQHDGYCSGGECSYEPVYQTKILYLTLNDEQYHDFLVDWAGTLRLDDDVIQKWLATELKRVSLEYYNPNLDLGSMYCDNDPVAEALGIEKHDSKFEFKDVVVLSVKKSKTTEENGH